MSQSNIRNLADAQPSAESSSDGGGGDGTDYRLRQVEDRLTRVETDLKYVAKKEDIADLKTYMEGKLSDMLKWGVGIMAAVVLAVVVS